MAEAARKRRIPLWVRIGLSVIAAVAVLALTTVGLRYWITSDGGRDFIVSQIDGRRIGPLGAIRISGLKGDPLTAASFADIALVDDEGVWLRARDARIQWTPERLFSGELEIAEINIRIVDVQRRPMVAPTTKRGATPDIGLKLDKISVGELRLAEGVLGRAATFSVSGGATRGREGDGSADLVVAPLTGPGDRLAARLGWTADGRLNGEADIHGSPGGAIAELVRAPEGADINLRARAAGAITAFTADAQLDFASARIAAVHVVRDGDTATLTGSLDAENWDLLQPVTKRTGGLISFEGGADLANLADARISLRANAPALKLAVGGRVNLNGGARLLGPVDVAASDADLSRLAPPLEGIAAGKGAMTIRGLRDWTWQGEADVANFTAPGVAISSARAPATVTMKADVISWQTRQADARGARLPAMKSLAADAYIFSSRGEVNIRTRRVELAQTQVSGRPGDATARGTYDIETGALDLAGGAVVARLSDVAPLTGSARGAWTFNRTRTGAPMRISLNAAGRNVSSRTKVLAEIAGPAPEVTAAIVVTRGRYAIESGSFLGGALEARMMGRISETGAIAGEARGRLRRPLDFGGAKLAALGFTADVSGDTSAPQVDISLSNGEIAAAGMVFDRLSGDAQATFGAKTTGQFALKGETSGQPVAARGRIAGEGGDWRLAGVEARIAGMNLLADDLAWIDGGLSLAFTASGSLAGLAGIERGDLTARGGVQYRDNDLAFDIAGQAANVRAGLTRIRTLAFSATARDDAARLTAQLRGTIGADLDLDLTVDAARRAVGWGGTARLNGKVDALPLSTPQPFNWAYGGGAWSIDGALEALNGRLVADIDAAPQAHTARLTLANLDMEALSRLVRIAPMSGQVSGEASFVNTGAATADVSLRLANANPLGVAANPVSMSFDGQLRNNTFAATAVGAGQGFRLDAAAVLPVRTGEGFAISPAPNAPLDGRVSLDGRAEQLWGLFGPQDQTLRGGVKADIRIAGTIASPLLDGGFSIDNADYEHGESGFGLRNISARGDFDQRSARITEVTATDGGSGRLTAAGEISWGESLDGALRFNATGLRALNRDDRSATVSGQGALGIDADAIRVAGDLHIDQARISIEQPTSASVPTLPGLRRVNFPNQDEEVPTAGDVQRPVRLDLKVKAERRVVVFGRGLDTEWSMDLHVTGPIADPEVRGTATLIRGDLALAGKRFEFDTGSINLDGPIRDARADISATRTADDIVARVRLSGTPTDPEFVLESTPALPQDEILARVLFGRSASELSAFEAAQIAAGLTQLAGGQAAFDPAGLIRQATGLDRVAFGASGGAAVVSAGKYIADDVYLELGAGGEGGVGAQVEWEPRDNLSITSSAQGNGDTRLAVRWKKDY